MTAQRGLHGRTSMVMRAVLFKHIRKSICMRRCAAAGSTAISSSSRAYPSEPRVGVGVVVFKKPITKAEEHPEVLLVRRSKEPAKGMWSFPGGSLELGESLASCAVREVLEETRVTLRNVQGVVTKGPRKLLQQPTPFGAADVIYKDDQDRLVFHYVVVQVCQPASFEPEPELVASMAADADATPPVAGDDVDDVQWTSVEQLRSISNLTPNCARVAEEACQWFDLSS